MGIRATSRRGVRGYSTNELIEELARRANEQRVKKPPHWCDECEHFLPWIERSPIPKEDCPDDYNPCSKGHQMSFMPPIEAYGEYGFFRLVCPDRTMAPDSEDTE